MYTLKEWDKKRLFNALKAYKEEHPETKCNCDGWYLTRLGENNLRKYILKLVKCKDGQDFYDIDPVAIEKLDSKRVEELLTEQKLRKNLPKQKERYLVAYIIETPGGFTEVEDDVEVAGRRFIGKDGKRHHINERCLRILERII